MPKMVRSPVWFLSLSLPPQIPTGTGIVGVFPHVRPRVCTSREAQGFDKLPTILFPSLFPFPMCVCFPACTCVHYMCSVPLEDRREHLIPRNWSYRWFGAAMRVLAIGSGSSTRAASALNSGTISPAPLSAVSSSAATVLKGCHGKKGMPE